MFFGTDNKWKEARVKILEILRDFRSDSVISKNVRNVQQV